ncbi:uncharacterized protein LOC116844328 [Odontomachus brunneus]|uniref:uncharacterized protein LOC116844328 n=1 Tax=Odontomachus brunneus TaxID=486640 RepID=UPI0013F26D82|nr:uncharacterized protein LOC116844328 [Odontomachus brunneus]
MTVSTNMSTTGWDKKMTDSETGSSRLKSYSCSLTTGLENTKCTAHGRLRSRGSRSTYRRMLVDERLLDDNISMARLCPAFPRGREKVRGWMEITSRNKRAGYTLAVSARNLVGSAACPSRSQVAAGLTRLDHERLDRDRGRRRWQ